jgi:predicted dehydrogenase
MPFINIINNFDDIINCDTFCWIISTSPESHDLYIDKAIRLHIPSFIEASVLDTNFDYFIKKSKDQDLLLAPSCTLYFHPAINKIKELIDSNKIGQISNVLYHSGQFLPDWHTYESVSDFYVSKKDTGGAREIVPFELTWLTKIFGFPNRVCGFYKKAIEIIGAEAIDDTYNLLLDYDSFILNLSVDVVSRWPTRKLLINGSIGQIIWDWDDNCVKFFNAELNEWVRFDYNLSPSQAGYNKNITEQMYIDELDCFLKAVLNINPFKNNLSDDWKVLKILYAAEKSSNENIICN